MPTVSVIISTYKRANLVSQAIESVLAQTYTDYEIIVVNDGSPDNTKEVLDQFGDHITAIHQENQGVSAARNAGIRAAQGQYIAFLDDDDLWLPNKLEKQIACLESNPKIGLVYSDMFCFDENGVFPHTWAKANPTPPIQECWILFVRNFIPTPSVVVRQECLDKVGLFDETLTTCEDYDLWLRIIEKWSVHFLNEPLVRYRRSANSLQSNEDQQLVNWLRVKENAFHRNLGLQTLPLMVLDQCFFNGYLSLAYNYIGRYQGEKARQALKRYQQLRGISSTSEWLWMISFPILNSSPASEQFS
ncbi:MAG: glycosyltransferase [Stigonema ocellatum SAG 48.90 = DSM 106950]|nr:glycosyltransferase [Stigonema ocellatum SAG 48.90 = DSM 106950]